MTTHAADAQVPVEMCLELAQVCARDADAAADDESAWLNEISTAWWLRTVSAEEASQYWSQRALEAKVAARASTITDVEIVALRAAADAAGDDSMAEMCADALQGFDYARRECARALVDSRLK